MIEEAQVKGWSVNRSDVSRLAILRGTLPGESFWCPKPCISFEFSVDALDFLKTGQGKGLCWPRGNILNLK